MFNISSFCFLHSVFLSESKTNKHANQYAKFSLETNLSHKSVEDCHTNLVTAECTCIVCTSSETYSTHACQHAIHILVIKWLETYRFALIYCQFLTLVHSYIYLLLSCMLFPYSNRIPFVRRHTYAYCGSLQLVHLHNMHMNFWFRCSETHMHIVVRSSLGMSGIRNQQHAVQRIVYTLSPHPGMDRMVVRWYSTGYAASMW